MVFVVTASSYPLIDALLTSAKISSAKGSPSAWNSLPQQVVDATSVNSFKNRLDAHWKTTGYGQ